MNNNQEQDSIVQLPLPERISAVALKHIFDEIKKIQEAQADDLKKVHHSFTNKFKEIEEKSGNVIRGTEIVANELKHVQKYFTSIEQSQISAICKAKTGIKTYWKTVINHYFGEEEVTEADNDIALAIQGFSTHIEEDSLGFTIKLGKNSWTEAGTYKKIYFLESGLVVKAEGDPLTWLQTNSEGIFAKLFNKSAKEEDLQESYNTATQFVNEIIPYSLQYFLTTSQNLQFIDESDSHHEQLQSQEQLNDEQTPSKRLKK